MSARDRQFKVWYWGVPILAAWAISFIWLKAAALLIHVIVPNAPLGIIGLLYGQSPISAGISENTLLIQKITIHGIFWAIFVAGIIGRNAFPKRLVMALYITMLLILITNSIGCATYFYIPANIGG